VNEKATNLRKAGHLARDDPSFGLGKTLWGAAFDVSYVKNSKLVRGGLWKRNLRPKRGKP